MVAAPSEDSKQQGIHLTGKGLVGMEDEDEQDGVFQGVLNPHAGSVFHEQPHNLLAAHTGCQGQRVLPKVDKLAGAVVESGACSSCRDAALWATGAHAKGTFWFTMAVCPAVRPTDALPMVGSSTSSRAASVSTVAALRLSQRIAVCRAISPRAPPVSSCRFIPVEVSSGSAGHFPWLPEGVETLESSSAAAYEPCPDADPSPAL